MSFGRFQLSLESRVSNRDSTLDSRAAWGHLCRLTVIHSLVGWRRMTSSNQPSSEPNKHKQLTFPQSPTDRLQQLPPLADRDLDFASLDVRLRSPSSSSFSNSVDFHLIFLLHSPNSICRFSVARVERHSWSSWSPPQPIH